MERTTEKLVQIQKYKTLLCFVVGVFLLAGGIWTFCSNATTSIFLTLLVICFGIVSLIGSFKQWLILSRGKILFIEKRAIPLKAGEIAFSEPACPYEAWIFCETPFFYYNGSICITRNLNDKSQTIKVPRRSPWMMWWWRSELYGPPIIWRQLEDDLGIKESCSIKFNLLPTFENTFFSNIVPTHDVELVTVLIKSANK